jgi:hypothetical protein
MSRPKPVWHSPYRALASGSEIYSSESYFQNFHPPLHVPATGGCFYNDAAFIVETLLTLNTDHFKRVLQNSGNKIIMP